MSQTQDRQVECLHCSHTISIPRETPTNVSVAVRCSHCTCDTYTVVWEDSPPAKAGFSHPNKLRAPIPAHTTTNLRFLL